MQSSFAGQEHAASHEIIGDPVSIPQHPSLFIHPCPILLYQPLSGFTGNTPPTPSSHEWWGRFEAGEVREEFALIASLGLQVVRIFLLWDDFHPTPEMIDSAALDNLATVCNIAAENGLKLDVTFFTGHMSGPNWAPRWLLGGPRPGQRQRHYRPVVSQGRATHKGYRNSYHDMIAMTAARPQLKTVVSTFKDHPFYDLTDLPAARVPALYESYLKNKAS